MRINYLLPFHGVSKEFGVSKDFEEKNIEKLAKGTLLISSCKHNRKWTSSFRSERIFSQDYTGPFNNFHLKFRLRKHVNFRGHCSSILGSSLVHFRSIWELQGLRWLVFEPLNLASNNMFEKQLFSSCRCLRAVRPGGGVRPTQGIQFNGQELGFRRAFGHSTSCRKGTVADK